MLLDLEDRHIRATISRIAGNKNKFTLIYPDEDYYREKVIAALWDLLHSKPATPEESEAHDRWKYEQLKERFGP